MKNTDAKLLAKKDDIDIKAKPILKWAGGKSGLLTQMLPLLPLAYNHYFEPFFGGGALFFSLTHSGKSFLNDLNSELIKLYETVRDFPEQLMEQLDVLALSYSENFYYLVRQQHPNTKIASAARTVFLNKTGFNGLYRQNARGGFNVPYGKRDKCPALYDRENMLRVSNSLQQATLQSQDFETVINEAGGGDLVYCDPPYEPLSRTSSFNAYQKGGFGQDEQIRLKHACLRAQTRGAYVLISNSSAAFIKELYSDCETNFISARRSINSKGNSRGKINEILVTLKPDFHGYKCKQELIRPNHQHDTESAFTAS